MHTRYLRISGAAAVTLTAAVLATQSASAHDHVLHLTARSASSTLFIPCPTCVLASQPDGAHIGGTQIDAGDLYDSAGHKIGHYALQSLGVTPSPPSALANSPSTPSSSSGPTRSLPPESRSRL